MKLKNKILTKVLMVFLLAFLVACRQNNSGEKTQQVDDSQTATQILTIDTFSTFPPEIDGCSCYFSSDSLEFKRSHYIYMNDYAQTCFMKLNGVLTKFVQVDFQESDSRKINAKYKNDTYEVIIESQTEVQNGDETSLLTGTIKVTDKNGKTISKTFYGECGC